MHAKHSRFVARPRRYTLILVMALAGVATAALVSAAIARTFTLEIARNAQIVHGSAMSNENIVANSRGHAVYTLSGDSKSHPKCTQANGCFRLWRPVTVAAGKKPSKAAGIRGRLRTWHRSGLHQVTLNAHPLYTYVADTSKGVANGDGANTFNGTWHVIKTSSGSTTQTTSTGTTTYPYG